MAEKPGGKAKPSCEENLLNLIELGYETLVHRVRSEKITQWFSTILKNLQNLQQVQQELLSYLRDVVTQWTDAVTTFSTNARRWAAMISGVVDVCVKTGYKVEDVMTYIDPLIDMMLGMPAVVKAEKPEGTEKKESSE
jgi:hypothetical protein